jgi:cell division protein FtsL
MKKKSRKLKLTGEEKFIIFIIISCVVGIFAVQIFLGAQISNVKMNIEKIDYKIENQEKKNESLTMQVNELTSYENVSKAIEKMGLSYNNENIVVINK